MRKKEKLVNALKSGDAIIRAHCDEARREAQLAIEEAHKQLEEMHKEIFAEIDEYEKFCQEKFKSIKQNNVEIAAIIQKANEFVFKSESLINQFQIDETDLKLSIDEAYRLFDEIEDIHDKLRSDMFNKTNLRFVKKTPVVDIGRLKNQNSDLCFLENLLAAKKEMDLSVIVNDKSQNGGLIIQPFNNRLFACLYKNKSKNLNISIFDREEMFKLKKKT